MNKAEKAKLLKEKYLEESKNNNCERKARNNYYSFAQLQALRDMAEADVHPDRRFGDEECLVWEMFYLLATRTR